MVTSLPKGSVQRRPPRKAPWSWIIILGVIGGILLTGTISAIAAGAAPKGILTNLGFYVSVSIVFFVLALGFNLQWGYTGLFNAGIAGFYLIGAYVAAIAITPPAPPIIVGGVVVFPGHLGGYSLPLIAGVFLAMLASGMTAAIVAIPALRLRADYLAIATLAFAVILQIITNNLQSVTGGAIGIPGIPPPIGWQGTDASFLNAMTMVGIGAFVLVLLLFVLQFMVESPWGRVLRAVREDEEATMALGKNTFNYKLQAFALGGALMGLAGALYAVTLGYLSPASSFAPAVTFSVWVMVIVGGSGNNRGALVGAFLIYGMEWLSLQVRDQVVTALDASYVALGAALIDIGVAAVVASIVVLVLGWIKPNTRWGGLPVRAWKNSVARGLLLMFLALYATMWLFVGLEQSSPSAVGDAFFYIRFMVIGVLLILLIIYRPEGILREEKRVLG
jgi:branched-chain amino acid transport system permease protein